MGPKNKHNNRHKFLLNSSTELLLASWPWTVAIQVCAVAMCGPTYLVRIKILYSSLFGAGEMSLLANGKENSVLIADT